MPDISNASQSGVCTVIIRAIDQSLKVLDFDYSALLVILYVGVDLLQLVAMLRKQLLDGYVAVEGLLVHAKDL